VDLKTLKLITKHASRGSFEIITQSKNKEEEGNLIHFEKTKTFETKNGEHETNEIKSELNDFQ